MGNTRQGEMLITGAAASDDSKTEKPFPQLTPIRSFPTTIFIDKKGTFYGPGTGKYFEELKKDFYSIVDGLLNEK